MDTPNNLSALGVSMDTAQQVGLRLRKARETIGRTTSALSAKIKVREHYLIAIENGQWSELPPGLNGRGLIRIYARELAVNVPELDQAANQTVMPAEHDAQAPYQIGTSRREGPLEKEFSVVRVVTEQRNTPPSANRSTDTTPKTMSNRSMRSHDLTPVGGRKTGVGNAGHRVIESTPDEEPLDVVTPDVASILGISLDMLEQQPAPRVASSRSGAASDNVLLRTVTDSPNQIVIPDDVTERDVPRRTRSGNLETDRKAQGTAIQNTTTKVAEETPVDAHATTSVQAVTSSDVQSLDQPVSPEPLASQVEIQEQPALEAAPAKSSWDNDESTQATVSQPTTSIEQKAVQPESVGVSTADAYLQSRSQTTVVGTEVTQDPSSDVSRSRGLRTAVVIMAACVLALIVGRSLMRGEKPESQTEISQTQSAPDQEQKIEGATDPQTATQSTQTDVVAPAADPSGAQSTPSEAVMSDGPADESAAPSVAAGNTDPEVNTGAPVNAETRTQVQALAPVSPDEAVSATSSAAVKDDRKASQQRVALGAGFAELMLSESIEIQVTADGKRVFNGRHQAGKVDIKFNKSAEIIVEDGSKAKLKYSGWDHGALGQSGRRRRIVLNASAFKPGSP